jgi:hypothetical protein
VFKVEYTICSFLCDLLKLRDKTFTKRIIKHSFKDLGIWPVSFRQVRRNIKVYRKKNKKDIGLDGLEFSGDPNPSDSDDYKDKVD